MNNKTRGKGLAIAISIGVALLCSARYTAPTTNILIEGAIPDSKCLAVRSICIVRKGFTNQEQCWSFIRDRGTQSGFQKTR